MHVYLNCNTIIYVLSLLPPFKPNFFGFDMLTTGLILA